MKPGIEFTNGKRPGVRSADRSRRLLVTLKPMRQPELAVIVQSVSLLKLGAA